MHQVLDNRIVCGRNFVSKKLIVYKCSAVAAFTMLLLFTTMFTETGCLQCIINDIYCLR